MKCRIQIRPTEGNYWRRKIPYSLGKKASKSRYSVCECFTHFLSPYVLLSPSPLSFCLCYSILLFLFFLTGTQVLVNFHFLSICLTMGVSYLTFYPSASFSFLSLYSFPSLSFCPCVCYMRGKNRWLFPLHCHQRGLIYDSHRVESHIKSLFTVKWQDH